ncbi:MAG: response regulator [Acidobacteria bacterium]|nr:response regulator [Acidobacteriota bacterium]MBV9067947.1 response regulator [Acidobacteriota bacterium]MBV9184044.1 response regulator [Acidobacteriota bacterium]
MKILVVEDQPAELKLAVHVLSAAGFEVDQAVAAEQAIAAIKEDRPQIILLDLSLPGVDGLTLARKLKADPSTREILIVAITSYPERFPMAEALAAGCDAYLPKPVSTRTLPETLRTVMKNAEGDGDR